MLLDPYKGPFACIEEAFEASVNSPRVLIDQYILPADNCLAIANAIRNDKARAITDGSYKNGKGTAGMTIHPGKTVTNKLSVLNWSPGTAEEQQPYRSELVGINGTLSALKIIVEFYKIQHGTIKIACDNMEAKNQSEKDEPYIFISQNCADIIQDIRLSLIHI